MSVEGKLTAVRAALDKYDAALKNREHGGVAAHRMVDEVRAALASPAPAESGEPVAWACVKCNSPRSVDPCPKCGTALTKPADGWEWPELPDVDRIRALAREVGYAVGVHGSLERDLDLIAVPWVESAIGPYGLALHIAAGLGGEVVDFKNQDKPCGRWSCNIHTPDWTKMIDLSVMPPHPPAESAGSPSTSGVGEAISLLSDALYGAGNRKEGDDLLSLTRALIALARIAINNRALSAAPTQDGGK